MTKASLYHQKLFSGATHQISKPRSMLPHRAHVQNKREQATHMPCGHLFLNGLKSTRSRRQRGSAILPVLRTTEKALPLHCQEKCDPSGSAAASWGSLSRKANLAARASRLRAGSLQGQNCSEHEKPKPRGRRQGKFWGSRGRGNKEQEALLSRGMERREQETLPSRWMERRTLKNTVCSRNEQHFKAQGPSFVLSSAATKMLGFHKPTAGWQTF